MQRYLTHRYKVMISNVTFYTPKLIDRCIVPMVNQLTGARNKEREPVETLKEFREFPTWYDSSGTPPYCFGMNAIHIPASGTIHVGDKVIIEYRKSTRWLPNKDEEAQPL